MSSGTAEEQYPLEEDPVVCGFQGKLPPARRWTHATGGQNEWLSLTQEQALEPELPIVDPHHHFFLPPNPRSQEGRQPEKAWLARYMPEDLAADVNSGHNVVATVFVACFQMYRQGGPAHLRYAGESEFVQGVAAIGEAGYLGPCRLCAGSVVSGPVEGVSEAQIAELLDAHATARGFRGMRLCSGQAHLMPWQSPTVRRTLALMEQRGVVFDVNGPESFPLDFAKVFAGIGEAARDFPKLRIVVDHCGGVVGPSAFGNGEEGELALAVWKQGVRSLAQWPNVHMKLGGITMPMNGLGLEKRAKPVGSEELAGLLRPYFDHCLDCFGPDRCMLESNFPMDKASCSYAVFWNACKRWAGGRGLSEKDKRALFAGTADRVYNLGLGELLEGGAAAEAKRMRSS